MNTKSSRIVILSPLHLRVVQDLFGLGQFLYFAGYIMAV
jgi:hypothetical protein